MLDFHTHPPQVQNPEDLPFEIGETVTAVVQRARGNRGDAIMLYVTKDEQQFPAKLPVDEAFYNPT